MNFKTQTTLCLSCPALLITVNTISFSSESFENISQVSNFPKREQISITPEWVSGYQEGFHLASGLFKVGQQSGRCEGNEDIFSLKAQIFQLKQQLEEKEYSVTLYKNAKDVDT